MYAFLGVSAFAIGAMLVLHIVHLNNQLRKVKVLLEDYDTTLDEYFSLVESALDKAKYWRARAMMFPEFTPEYLIIVHAYTASGWFCRLHRVSDWKDGATASGAEFYATAKAIENMAACLTADLTHVRNLHSPRPLSYYFKRVKIECIDGRY